MHYLMLALYAIHFLLDQKGVFLVVHVPMYPIFCKRSLIKLIYFIFIELMRMIVLASLFETQI